MGSDNAKQAETLVNELKYTYPNLFSAEPMKPIIRGGNQGLLFYECPRCHTSLAHGHYFCPKKDCGQALDWSYEDENIY